MLRSNRHLKLVALLSIAAVGLLAHLAGVTAASAGSPELQVKTAWRNANLADSFSFATDLAQTTYPAPALTNVGRSSRTDSMRIEGKVDRPSQTILMSLWNGDGSVLNTGNALDLRVVNGVAEGRVSGGDWQKVDNVADAFAPSGDMLGFLAGATNIQRQTAADNGQLPIVYKFDMDGPALAEHLRAQLEAQLAAKGELPAGVYLDTPGVYKGAVGSGEIWITPQGYPARLTLSMDLPEQANGEHVTVHFISQLNAFQSNRVTSLTPDPFAAGLLSIVDSIAATLMPQFNLSFVFSFGLILACLWILIRYRRSRRLYAVVVLTMIFAMVFSPLWQAGQVYAFSQKQNAQAAQQDATRKDQAASQDLLQQVYANTWDPHRNPLGASPASAPITPSLPVVDAPAAGNALDITAIDGTAPDLSSFDAVPGIARTTYNSMLAASTTITDTNGDDDGDGLTNIQEARLGTDPNNADTDSDGIPDGAEVHGFSYNNKLWYLNPKSTDTNGDGLTDTEECPQLIADPVNGVCQDTNGDGVPDAFSRDNDGDGVPDNIDLSPYGVMGSNGLVTHDPQTFTNDSPMQLQVNGLQSAADGKGYQTFVDFQVRPTDTKHLWYALNVYNWSNGDTLGQIRRPLTDTNGLTNTIFATYDPNGPANNSNGDVRLVPMLEIRMTGPALPVPLITPHAAQRFADQGITGTVTLDVTGTNAADTQFTFTFSGTATYTATVGSGSCLSSNNLATGSVTNGGSFSVANQLVTALANGQNIVRLTDASGARKTCVQLIDIPNAGLPNKMVDTSFLAPYGVSVRDLNADTLVAYVPLNLTSDPATGDRVAFSARMPYWPSDPGNWGKNQKVRMVWLVTMLTPDGGASVIQTYPDSWTLTGLSVREDRGLDLAIAFEDPAKDDNPKIDNHLTDLKDDLASSFLTARDSNNDGQPDVTIADIRQRFDNTQNASVTDVQRWGLPINAFRVYTYSFPQQDYLAQVMMTDTVNVLNTHFMSGGLPLSQTPLLLYAYVARSRQLDLGGGSDLVKTENTLLTLNLDPASVLPQVVASLNWMPYRYDTGQWQTYPLAQFADKLTVDFQTLFANLSEDERIANAAILQGDYLAAINGTSRLIKYKGQLQTVESNNDAVLKAMNDKSEPYSKKIKSAVESLEQFLSGDAKASLLSGASKFIKLVSPDPSGLKIKAILANIQRRKMLVSGLPNTAANVKNLVENSAFRTKLSNSSLYKGVGLIGGMVVMFFILGSVHNESAIDTISGAFTLAASGVAIYSVQDALKIYSSAVRGVGATGRDLFGTIKLAKDMGKAAKYAKLGAVLAIGIAWGLAAYELSVTGFNFASGQALNIIASAVAATIVALIMLAIALIPVFGQIAAAFIEAIDAIIAVTCYASGKDFSEKNDIGKRFCKGLQGLAGEMIKTFLYSRRSLVNNLQSDTRLDFSGFALTWDQPDLGMVQDAAVTLNLDVKNTIILSSIIKSSDEFSKTKANDIIPLPLDPLSLPFFWELTDTNLKSATFAYQLQAGTDKADIHSGLERNTMNSEWNAVPGQDHTFTITKHLNITTDKAARVTGINQPLDLYLAEGQATPAQQCIGIPVSLVPPAVVIPSCWIATDKNTNSIPLGSSLIYDILPRTLDGFTALTTKGAAGGYSLAWAQTGDLTFPVQCDADGDGLRSKACPGGNDPNDSKWDSDGDGLSDYAELRIGSDPQNADTDGDGLSDFDEVILGTNPLRADTDGDGLKDKEEVDGWQFVYDLTSAGQLKSWVTSNPLNADEDGDNLTDVQERTYGFNPHVANSSNVLTYEAQVVEQAAPRLLLRFEQPVNSQAFADSSGYNVPGACVDAASCPTTGVAGVFGNAALFDGAQDQVRATPSFNLANSSFTIAFWARRSGTGIYQAAFSSGNGTANQGLFVGFRDTNVFTCAFVNAADLNTPASYTDTDWHHWACTYNAGTRQRTIYRDGAQVAQDTAPANYQGAGIWAIGNSTWFNSYFNGRLDDMAVFDRALSASEVSSVQAGTYNANDLIVRPNDVLTYASRVKNELLGPFANGLLSTDFPKQSLTTSNLPPATFVLQPQQQATITGTITVGAAAASGSVTLTQVAEASIQDRSAQSNYAETWIKFDEGPGALGFADSSGNVPERNATCLTGQCPASNAAGRIGSAATFNGSNTVARISGIDLANQSFTVAFWAQRASSNRNDFAIGAGGTSGLNDTALVIGFRNNNKFTCGFFGDDLDTPLTYTDSDWHHWSCTYNAVTRQRTIYRDAVQVAQGSAAANYQGAGDILIGQYPLGGNFFGQLDDLRMFKRVLSSADISAITLLPVLKLTFDTATAGSTTFVDTSGQRNAVTCSATGGQCPALQGGVLGAAPRFYDPADAATADDFYRVANSTALNLNDGNFTLMAWVYPANTGDSAYDAYPQGLIGYNSGDANAMPSLQRVGLKLRFGFGAASGWISVTTPSNVLTVGAWQQVAATAQYDQPTTKTTVHFYVNGLEVNNQIMPGKPAASNFQLMIGRSDENGRVQLEHANIYKAGDYLGPVTCFCDEAQATWAVYGPGGSPSTVSDIGYCYENNLRTGNDTGISCAPGQALSYNWADNKWFDITTGSSIAGWEVDEFSAVNKYFGADDWMFGNTFNGITRNGNYPSYTCNGGAWDEHESCWTLYWNVDSIDAVAFAGRMDEVAIYKRSLSAAEMLAVFDTVKGGQLFRLDEPPGSTSLKDETGVTQFTCSACPTTGVAGRMGQGVQFVTGQYLAVPWTGGDQEGSVSLWFKTPSTGVAKGLFSIGDADRSVWLDAAGHLNANLDGGLGSQATLINPTQSSTYAPGWEASRAIDNDLNTATSTNNNYYEWWSANLSAGTQTIRTIRIDNIADPCCQNRLNDFNVYLRDSTGHDVWRADHLQATANPTPTVINVPFIRATKVVIQTNSNNYLNLAEVKVYVNQSSPSTWSETNANYADNQWHHLLFTFGSSVGGARMYIDGQNSVTASAYQSMYKATQFYLGTARNLSWLDNGTIDQVRLYSRALTAADDQRLYSDPPKALFKFDEAANASTFANAANTGVATCAAANCPVSGVAGRIGLAAQFNGLTSTLQMNDSPAIDFSGPFAIGAWFNAKDWASAVNRTLVSKANQYDLWEQANIFYLRVYGAGVATMTVPALNQWQYVVGNYTGGALQLWLNGSLAASVNASGTPVTTANPLFIGARDGAASSPFSGLLDDLSFYNHYLSEPEIRAQYLYQVGLVSERQSYRITIDNDLPTAALRSDTAFLPNSDRMMDINASDPTSDISLVQLGSQKDGEGAMQWAGAPLCRDVSGTSEWCITFIPRGEGRYTLRPRAIDAVGHTGGVSDTVVYVDGTGPQVTLNALPAIVAPVKQSAGWTVPLSGTVNDPLVPGGFAGSGVVTDSVRLTLLDVNGSPAGLGQQRSTVTGSNWQVDYAFIDAEPLGTFTVTAEAADQVGNTTRVTLGALRLDSVGPVAELGTSFPVWISSTAHFSGTATEIDVPRSAAFFVPFEEPAGSTVFLDSHAPRNVAVGRLAAQSSDFAAGTGAGLAVDGNTDGNYFDGSISHSNLEPQPWWQVDLGLSQSIGKITLWNRTDCCADRLSDFYVFVSSDPFTATNPALTQAQPGVWSYHYSGTAGTSLDIPTVDVNSRPVTGRYVRVQLNGTNYLALAEVQVFSTQLNAGRCTPPTCPTLGQPGAVGSAAKFDGVTNQVRATPAFTLANTSFSVAFWAKRNTVGGSQLAFGSGDTSANNHGLLIGFSPSNQFECGFYGNDLYTPAAYTDSGWHHWVCTYAADTQQRVIYRDGVQVAQDIAAANYQGTGDWFIGSSAWPNSYFNGSLDEVAIFSHVLSAADIRHIGQPAVAGVQGVDVAFTQINSGIYNEPVPADQRLYLPLDDGVDKDGKLIFKDLAANARGTCTDSKCPAVGGTGMRGGSAKFDGDDNYISVNMAQAITGSFTVAAWVRPQPDSLDLAVGVMGTNTFNFMMGRNTISATIGTNIVTTPFDYTPGQWSHVAYVVTPAGYTLYVNGNEIDAGSFSGQPVLVNAGGVLLIGDAGGTKMKGWLDEVRVFSRALAGEEIHGLYLGSEPQLKLDFENNIADTSVWSWGQTVAAPSPDQTPRFMSGQVGQSSAAFDGVNDRLTASLYTLPASFTIGFWAKRNPNGSDESVISGGTAAIDQGLFIGFRNTNVFTCAFYADDLDTPAAYTDTVWHQWVCTYDAITRLRTIYRDGVLVVQDTAGNYQLPGTWTIGNSPWLPSALNGSLDDLRLYPRALSNVEVTDWAQSSFRAAGMTASGSGVSLGRWTAAVPAGLEGVYRLDARGRDMNSLSDLSNLGNEQWLGLVDSLAPRIPSSYKTNAQGKTLNVFSVQDYNLNLDGFSMSGVCSETGSNQPKVYHASLVNSNQAWYRLGGGEARPFEVSVACSQPGLNQPALSLTACDLLGNCTAPTLPLNVTNNAIIYAPVDGAVITTTGAISVTGEANAASAFLHTVTLLADGVSIYSTNYPVVGTTHMTFTTNWNLAAPEGKHNLQLRVLDWNGQNVFSPVNYTYLDLTAPQISFGSTILTGTAYILPDVYFTGPITETGGVVSLTLKVGDTTVPGRVDGNRWSAGWPVPDVSAPPDAVTYPVTVTVTDLGGRVATVSASALVDVIPPVAQPQFSVDGQPLLSSLTITHTGPHTYTLNLPPATDGSGVAGYWYGYSFDPDFILGGLKFTPYSASPITLTGSIPSSDGDDVYLHLLAVDNKGNQSDASHQNKNADIQGPIYFDTPAAPDYTGMKELAGPYIGGPYRGWMDSGCTNLGQDLRIPHNASKGDALTAPQKLYATWGSSEAFGQGLRLTWSGADWNRDGNLFIYLDTIPDQLPSGANGFSYIRNGGNVAYNPYPATASSTLMMLPVAAWDNSVDTSVTNWPTLNRMNADYAVWVENNSTIHLLRWDTGTNAWVDDPLPGDVQLNFTTKAGDAPLTEIFLPFPRIGTSYGSNLSLVAFASEDHGLRVWSAIPANNPASSRRVMLTAPAYHRPLELALTDRYSMTLAIGQCSQPSYKTYLNIVADPGGLPFASKNDDPRLLWPHYNQAAYATAFDGYDANYTTWLANFCANIDPAANECTMPTGFKPEDKFAPIVDVNYPTLLPGQHVTYTIHYNNEFPTGQNFLLKLDSSQNSDPTVGGGNTIQWSPTPLALTNGCVNTLNVTLPANSQGELTLGGVVLMPTRWAAIRFEKDYLLSGCTVTFPNAEPYNILQVFNPLDLDPPSYIAIDQPQGVASPITTTVSGAVLDASPVPTITLEVKVGGGSTHTLTCPDDTSTDGAWACDINAKILNGGSTPADGTALSVRASGTDAFGHTSVWTAWQNLIIDTQAPTVALSADMQNKLADKLIGPAETLFSGSATDNHLLAGIDVCATGGSCTPAALTLDPASLPRAGYTYEDVPDAPTTIIDNECLGNTIVTFNITDTFTVKSLNVGLNITHPIRKQLRVLLTAPDNTYAWLTEGNSADAAQNYDMWLTDATSSLITDDRSSHNTIAPYYENVRHPEGSLAVFEGKSAAGTWELSICDAAVVGVGTYNRAELSFNVNALAQNTQGAWTYTYPFTQSVDGLFQTLNVYGSDSLGNRMSAPRVITFTADNVAPMLAVGQSRANLYLSTPSQPIALTGVVSDGVGVKGVMVSSLSPSGQLQVEPVTFPDGGVNLRTPRAVTNWNYTLTPLETGLYNLSVSASDLAGNTVQLGTYPVQVNEQLVQYLILLPVVEK